MIGGDVERKRRPSIQATLLAGEIVVYWGFALALLGCAAVFVLLLALKRPPQIEALGNDHRSDNSLLVFLDVLSESRCKELWQSRAALQNASR
jgi:hypothetical protein